MGSEPSPSARQLRMACVELPGYPLQVLAQHEPMLREVPAVALDRDDPNGRVLARNRGARAAGIQTGMRWSAALSLASALTARVLTPEREARGREALLALLRDAGPAVEVARHRSGVFWVDASGLRPPQLEAWTRTLHQRLTSAGWVPHVAVGFSRSGTLGGVLTTPGPTIFADREEERACLDRVPLQKLGLARGDLARLHRLGLRQLGQLRSFDTETLRRRFDAELLGRIAHLCAEDPLPLARPDEIGPERARLDWELPESRVGALLDAWEAPTRQALLRLARRGLRLGQLTLTLTLDDRSRATWRVPFAEPADRWASIRELARLHIEREPPRAGVVAAELTFEGRLVEPAQQQLFEVGPCRDLTAGNRALDRVRATLGEDAVFTLTPRDGHLPEDQIQRTPLRMLVSPRPPHAPRAVLIRELHEPPRALASGPWDAPDGVFANAGAVVHCSGPWALDGGWWETPWARAYFHVETSDGQLLWVYHDRRIDRWFLHGRVA